MLEVDRVMIKFEGIESSERLNRCNTLLSGAIETRDIDVWCDDESGVYWVNPMGDHPIGTATYIQQSNDVI